MERIAARQHRYRAAAMFFDLRHGLADRAGPRHPAATDDLVGEAEMTLAAHHQRGAAHELARYRRQAGDAVLADADDGQPTLRRAVWALNSHGHAPSHPD